MEEEEMMVPALLKRFKADPLAVAIVDRPLALEYRRYKPSNTARMANSVQTQRSAMTMMMPSDSCI